MIHKLHIKNFKLIKDNSFDFKPLTIITGTNSCGKSSILQTLCFFIRLCHNKWLIFDEK
ncbi:AAA family ATPase [Campylobacter coli]|nr:AAA family ATPase [Campylobacter coli]